MALKSFITLAPGELSRNDVTHGQDNSTGLSPNQQKVNNA